MALSASSMKMVVLPVLSTLAAWLMGFSGNQLGLLFLFLCQPHRCRQFRDGQSDQWERGLGRQYHRHDHADGQRDRDTGYLRSSPARLDMTSADAKPRLAGADQTAILCAPLVPVAQ